MTNSMTAFARKEKQAESGQAAWEIRSVNHRYLEIVLSLPDTFSHLEPLIRKQLQARLQRGRVEAKLRYKSYLNKAMPIEIDEELTLSLIGAYKKIGHLAHTNTPLNPGELLRWPQLLKFPELSIEVIQPELMTLFSETLEDFCQVRSIEGKAIFELLNLRLTKLADLLQHIQIQLPHILHLQREKVLARLHEIKTSLDPNRLEQEMLLFAQKTDVAEELDRLQIHLHEFKNLLAKNQAQGKQLDFLLQELNREANTLASKSLNAELTLSAVNVKVLIEEMREQVQNIE
ncbi:YicC/YloC family endoribonuclease [Rickettsiella endosymbiont of Miltochrista miniata]|uniref:YicC/YloC family endoribonuclease n=1 Tax=Rickettsiella endosymbiont of Miltochrista miniata TaxID=3066239 RepID=UPI00313B2192